MEIYPTNLDSTSTRPTRRLGRQVDHHFTFPIPKLVDLFQILSVAYTNGRRFSLPTSFLDDHHHQGEASVRVASPKAASGTPRVLGLDENEGSGSVRL